MTKQKQFWHKKNRNSLFTYVFRPFANRLKIDLWCILFPLSILELFLQLHWSPPVINSIDWTWFGKAHTCLYKVPQLTVHVRMPSVTSGGDLAPYLRWSMVVSAPCCGDVFQCKETSQDRWKDARDEVQRDPWWKPAPEHSGPRTGMKVHLPTGQRH